MNDIDKIIHCLQDEIIRLQEVQKEGTLITGYNYHIDSNEEDELSSGWRQKAYRG